MDGTTSIYDTVLTAITVLGWPTLLGCLPWAIGGALTAYTLSLRYLRRREAARIAKQLEQGGMTDALG